MKPLNPTTSQEIYQYCLEQKRKRLYPENFTPLLTVTIASLLLYYGEQYKDLLFEALDDTMISDRYDFDNDPNHLIENSEINQSYSDTCGLITHHINFNTIPFQIDHTIFLNQEIYTDFQTTIETIQHEMTHLFHKALGKFERQKKEFIYNWGVIEETFTKNQNNYDATISSSILEELFTTESAASQLRNWIFLKESFKEIPQMKQYIATDNFPHNYQSKFYSDLLEITQDLRRNRPLWNQLDQYTLCQPGITAMKTSINNLLEDDNGFQSLQHNLKAYIQNKDDLEQEALDPVTKQECEENKNHSEAKVKKLIHTMNYNHWKQRKKQ